MLEDTVSKQSGGRIKLKIRKLHYNYFTEKMVLDEAVFTTTDTATAPSAYRFDIPEMRIKLNGLFPLLFEKKLLIDSLSLLSPQIQVTTLRYSTDTVKKKEDISIPYEMGKVYRSIQDALQVLQVKQFRLSDGVFKLINKVEPDQLPLVISHIDFDIDNLQVNDENKDAEKKILFSDNVIMRSANQNILFPDGRHRLSFSRFRINLQKKLVEFDSCTIEAPRKDSIGSSFKVFFNALLLTNIDFDTLYRAEVIKADSVYCVNPQFTLAVELGKKSEAKRNPPKLENIIGQLTGDLQLGFVVVENADFDIRTNRGGTPSSFTFTRNNFEMQGLSVIQNSPKPITVKGFAMAIRNYENFIKDSSYSVKFDSVIFKNDQLTLSNFLFNKLDNGRIINTFSVPRFSLEGLSWDYLVFERKLKARQADMYQPVISYTASSNRRNKAGSNIIYSLGVLNEYMDLEKLRITEGDIDLKLRDKVRVQLNKATLSVESHSLLTSTKLSGIRNSLTDLNFDNGKIEAGDLTIRMENIHYAGNQGNLAAGMVTISDKNNNTDVRLKNATIDKLLVNEYSGDITASGIRWKEAAATLNITGSAKKTGQIIQLENISGANTTISLVVKGKIITAKLDQVSTSRFSAGTEEGLVLGGLTATGQGLRLKDNENDLSVNTFSITDNQSSYFTNIFYKTNSPALSAGISIPSASFIPDIKSILSGTINIDEALVEKPVIEIRKISGNTSGEKSTALPRVNIGSLRINAPRFNITRQNEAGTTTLNWMGQNNPANFIQVQNLRTNSTEGNAVSAAAINMFLSDFRYNHPAGKTFNTGNGQINARLSNLHYAPKDDDNPEWNIAVDELKADDLKLDSLVKPGSQLFLQSIRLNDLHLGSAGLLKMQQMVQDNPAFQFSHFTGFYHTQKSKLEWANAGFSHLTKIFTLDSFLYKPALSVDSFLATKQFQSDYISTSTGRVEIGPVDVNRFIYDSLLLIKKATIDKAFLYDYKDKSLPFNAGLIKPLPVSLLKKIPVHLRVDSVLFTNAAVDYTEENEKTGMKGSIPVTRMTVSLANVKNIEPGNTDSLHIKATGYLLDTVWVRLQVNESYTDSLGGFLMTVRMKPGDLTVLNKALIPLASLKLLSGQLDTLELRAVGREYLALGKMKMFYKDLKIQLLKDGKDGRQSFFTRMGTFFVNAFVIRSKNMSRMGDAFFIRQRDRSAMNYLIKITISGMSSSTGAKSNKKMMRRYRQELEKRKLPPIDLD